MKNLIFALVAAFSLAISAVAQEQKFESENFAITPPSGWDASKKAETIMTYTSPDGKQTLFLFAREVPNGFQGPINEKFVDGFNNGFEKSSGATLVSDHYTTMNGIKAYERNSALIRNGVHFSVLTRFCVADGKSYILQVNGTETDPSRDPAVIAALDSFHFLKPPVVQSAAYQIGYNIGRYGILLVVPLAVLGGIIALVVVIVRHFTRRNRREW